MKRRLAAALTACLLIPAAIPSSAFAAPEGMTCRIELTAVHSPLLGFGIAQIPGNVHVVPVVTCLDLAQQSYTITGRTWVEFQSATDRTGQPFPGTDRYCSNPSVFGAATAVCSSSISYFDPALAQANFRGCFDLSKPVDLPVRCVAAVTTP